MPLEIRINFEAVNVVQRMSDTLLARLANEVNKQTAFFISGIQKTQMSGRQGGRYLNVDTGNLRRSWFPETKSSAGVITTRAFTNVKYAAVHQYGGRVRNRERDAILSFRSGKARFVSPSKKGFATKAQGQYQMKVKIGASEGIIPKRLFVLEEFQREMPGRYAKAIQNAFNGAKRG